MSDVHMTDDAKKREERKRPARFTNRKMRRHNAKVSKLFSVKDREVWRKANAHMKGEDQHNV